MATTHAESKDLNFQLLKTPPDKKNLSIFKDFNPFMAPGIYNV